MSWKRPIERAAPVRDVVYDTLRQAIVSGELVPESKVMTTELAARLQVSRTPVREAVQRLIQEGLLERLASGVTRVRPVSRQEVADMMAVRAALEAHAARQAIAEGLDADTLGRLRAIWSEMVTLGHTPGDHARAVELNEDFHGTIRRAYGNRMLDELLQTLGTVTLRNLVYELQAQLDLDFSNKHHLAILEALEAGDAELAAELARAHVELATTEILKVLDRRHEEARRASRQPVAGRHLGR